MAAAEAGLQALSNDGKNKMLLDHFDLVARFYDRAIGPHEAEQLREQLDLPGHGRLLDIAGGTGRVLTGLKPWEGTFVLCDYSFPMLRQAKQKHSAALVRAAAEKLPFADNFFERILIVDALHHLTDQTRALAEMWRVLTPGGRLVIEEFDVHHWAVKIVAILEKIALMRSHFMAPAEIQRLMENLGANVQVRYQGSAKAWVIAEKPG